MNVSIEDTPVFSAADSLKERWKHTRPPKVKPPETVILCYQSSLMDYARHGFAIQRVSGFFGDVYLIKVSGGKIALAGNFGIGAPAAVIQLEELAAFGVRRFISLGLAGSIQPEAAPGDWLVCSSAVRDEGTSRHYLPAGTLVEADDVITAFLQERLASRSPAPEARDQNGHEFAIHSGATWTTDAPYRETRGEVAAWQQQGVYAVDMETSAVLSAGRALGAHVGAAVVLADQVFPDGWAPPADTRLIQKSLRRLLDTVVGSLIAEIRAQKGSAK